MNTVFYGVDYEAKVVDSFNKINVSWWFVEAALPLPTVTEDDVRCSFQHMK